MRLPSKPLQLPSWGLSLHNECKPGPRRGSELNELGIIKDGAVLCLGGKIVSVSKTKDALSDPWIKKNRLVDQSKN